MSEPAVSVVIPTRERRALLAQAIGSVRGQTATDWELLVVDDGSRDGSFEWLETLSGEEPRIRPVRRPCTSSGAPACRNAGARIARGRFLVFLDSDDVLAPHCLAQRGRYLDEHPELDLAVFPMLLFEGEPGPGSVLWNLWHARPCVEHCDLQRFLAGEDPPWQTAMPIWRKSSFERLGGWDEAAASWQDWELHVRALIAGLRYELVTAPPDSHCRQHAGHRISQSIHDLAIAERRVGTLRSIVRQLRDSSLSESVWVPNLLRLLASQAERAVLLRAPPGPAQDLIGLAREIAPGSRLRWSAIGSYVRVQRAATASGLPWVRGALRLISRTLCRSWFSSGQTYARRRLSEAAAAALEGETARPGERPSVDWSRELTVRGVHGPRPAARRW